METIADKLRGLGEYPEHTKPSWVASQAKKLADEAEMLAQVLRRPNVSWRDVESVAERLAKA